MTKPWLFAIVTTLALSAGVTPAAAEPLAYYTDSYGLERIDLATGDVELIFLDTGGSLVVITAMAASPDGVLYALDSWEGRLLVVDPQAAQAQVVGDLGVENITWFDGMTFDACGRLWAMGFGPGGILMYSIDPATGAAEATTPVQWPLTGLAALGETLYTIDGATLATVDPLTGEVSHIGGPAGADSIDFAADGTLWGAIGRSPAGGSVPGGTYTFDLTTGATTQVADIFFVGSAYGLSIGPPPGTCQSGAPPAIPTASGAGLALLAALLAAGGALALGRRRAAD